MKYNVVISGISQKISLGSVSNEQRKKIINFSKETNISVSETIFNELTDVLNCEWSDICDIDIIDGAIPDTIHLLVVRKQKGSLLDEIIYLDEKIDLSKIEIVCDTFTLTDGSVYSCIQGFNYGDDFYVLNPLDVWHYQFQSKFIKLSY